MLFQINKTLEAQLQRSVQNESSLKQELAILEAKVKDSAICEWTSVQSSSIPNRLPNTSANYKLELQEISSENKGKNQSFKFGTPIRQQFASRKGFFLIWCLYSYGATQVGLHLIDRLAFNGSGTQCSTTELSHQKTPNRKSRSQPAPVVSLRSSHKS